MAEPQTTSSGAGQKPNGGIVDRVKETATAQLTTQKDRGTDALGRVADAVRSSTQKLRDERHETIASYVDRAADQIENWSRRLRDKDVDELVADVQRLARRQPAVFIGSAFALGLVGARFLKSSRPRNEDRNRGEFGRSRYGSSPSAGFSGGFTGQDAGRQDFGVASEATPGDINPSFTPSPTIGTEPGRPYRGRRSNSRTEQT
jgi:hypothetical protein